MREAAAVGVPHEVKGETAWIFCCLLPGFEPSAELEAEIAATVAGELGKAFAPGRVVIVDALPKTRSAKIVRRAVRRPRSAAIPATSRRSRTPSPSTRSRPRLADRVALVTGGGRGIGANVARALAEDGCSVVVAARTREQVEAVAAEIGGRALELDVASAASIDARGRGGRRRRAARQQRRHHGPSGHTWEVDPDDWWRTFEVNVRGALLCVAPRPGMLERGAADRQRRERAAVSADRRRAATPASRARARPRCTASASCSRRARAARHPVFSISPGLVRTAMTEDVFPDDAPWTPPEAAPTLVRKLATGRYDALAGRYLHAEHDDLDDLIARLGQVRDDDLNAIRLRR